MGRGWRLGGYWKNLLPLQNIFEQNHFEMVLSKIKTLIYLCQYFITTMPVYRCTKVSLLFIFFPHFDWNRAAGGQELKKIEKFCSSKPQTQPTDMELMMNKTT